MGRRVTKEDTLHAKGTLDSEAGRGAARPGTASKNAGAGHFAGAGNCGSSGAVVGGLRRRSSTPAPPPPVATVQPLQIADVQNIVQAAVNSVNVDMVVAVVDRAGFVLGVFRTQNAPATAVGNFGQSLDANDVAVALARTGAFFSNDQAPLSSRTVRFISGIHFPPGVTNAPPADLYGIENTNRGCTLVNSAAFQSQIPPSLALSGGFGPGVLTGKADVMDSNPLAVNPGGVPIFYQNVVVGGIGVVTSSSDLNVAEYAAFVGSTTQRTRPSDSFGPTPAAPGVVFIGGVALPFVTQTSLPSGVSVGPVAGTGSYFVAPANSAGQPPDGDLITPAAGPLGGLSADGRANHFGQCGSDRKHDARGDSIADWLARADGDCGCRSGWHDDRLAADAGCNSFQHRCGGQQSAQHGVLQQLRADCGGFESGADGHGRYEPYDQLWRAAFFPAGD